MKKGTLGSGSLLRDIAVRERECRKIYQYLDKYVKKVNSPSFREFCGEIRNTDILPDKTIWICWLQGLWQAPELVQACVKSVYRNRPEDFNVVILTEENLCEYVAFPDYIEEKIKNGIISRTHKSDLIRAELLYQYGGVWIDATVYCGRMFGDYLCQKELFAFQWSLLDPSVLKISSWFIYSKSNHPIFRDTRNLLFAYWKEETHLKNYYLFHIVFSKAVDCRPQNLESFLSMMYVNNSNPHVLYGKLAQEFDEKEWKAISKLSVLHKLSYKKKFIQGDIYNYYMALLDGKLID